MSESAPCLGNFRDCYQTDQIAHDDILRALKSNKGVNMAMQEIAGDIEDYSFYIQDNKTDKDLKNSKEGKILMPSAIVL